MTKAKAAPAPSTTAPEVDPNYISVDRKGVWVFSNARFPLEDPTNAGQGPLTRFEERSYTQAPKTPWLDGQWKAGTFKLFTGDPRDDDTKEVVYEEPKPEPKVETKK